MWGFKDKGPVNNDERFKRLRSPEELAKIAKKRAREKRKKKEAERERLAKIQEDEEERQWLIDHGELDPDDVAVDAHNLLENGPNVEGGNEEEEGKENDGHGVGEEGGGIAFHNDGHVMSDDDMDDLDDFVVDTGANGMHEDDISTVGGGVHLD